VLTGELGHPRVDLHAKNAASGRPKRLCGDASTDPDIEHIQTRA
jgi:hypothetical protein